MAFNNIMQLATATLAGKGVFANNPTVVEWGKPNDLDTVRII